MTRPTTLLFWDVDTQYDFMRPDGRLYVPGAESILGNLSRLSSAAETAVLPIVASADEHRESDPEISKTPDFVSTYPPHCMLGTPGAERVPETRQSWTLEVGSDLLDDDVLEAAVACARPLVLIKKNTVDVFSNPNTEIIVERLTPQRIAIYGVALDICNRYAIEGLLSRGYRRLTLVTDAARPIDADRGVKLLRDWQQRGVELLTTSELLAEFEH